MASPAGCIASDNDGDGEAADVACIEREARTSHRWPGKSFLTVCVFIRIYIYMYCVAAAIEFLLDDKNTRVRNQKLPSLLRQTLRVFEFALVKAREDRIVSRKKIILPRLNDNESFEMDQLRFRPWTIRLFSFAHGRLRVKN